MKTWDLYEIGLELKECANAGEPDARLLGNIRAGDLAEMALDYVRLRLVAGISDMPENKNDVEIHEIQDRFFQELSPLGKYERLRIIGGLCSLLGIDIVERLVYPGHPDLELKPESEGS